MNPIVWSAVLGILLVIPRATCEEKPFVHKIDVLKNMDELDNARRFEQGDTVCIRIPENKCGGMQQVVATTGEIVAPYVGLIKAEGLTCKELAFRIKSELKKLEKSYPVDFKTSPPVEKNFFADATVLVAFDGIIDVLPLPPSVAVLGSVAKQGPYDLASIPDHKLSSLLKKAGGLTTTKGQPEIKIIRKTPQGNKTIFVNAQKILSGTHPEMDLILLPNDVLIAE